MMMLAAPTQTVTSSLRGGGSKGSSSMTLATTRTSVTGHTRHSIVRRRWVRSHGGVDGDDAVAARVEKDAEEDAPVAVFVNRKSGGRRGTDVLKTLRTSLKAPHKVFDTSQIAHAEIDARTSKVLVCGGDGTVGLVSDALREKNTGALPMAILPLGTGNDLARVLGWKNQDAWDDLNDEEKILDALRSAEPCEVDRWRVDITDRKPRVRSKLFTNYLGIGVDARAALAFHEARKVYPWLFVHELTNKLLYAVFGSRDFIEHSFARLRDDLVVTADGVVLQFPDDTEGVILCNINSFSGGVKVWHDDDDDEDDYYGRRTFSPSRKDDGVIEIVAVSGALHLGQLNVRMSTPVRIAQARDVSIELKRKLPVQVDGEPWLQRRGRLDVRLQDSFRMLKNRTNDKTNAYDGNGTHRLGVNNQRAARHINKRVVARLVWAVISFAAFVAWCVIALIRPYFARVEHSIVAVVSNMFPF
jgi:diacylglycerol kinase (ATP)